MEDKKTSFEKRLEIYRKMCARREGIQSFKEKPCTSKYFKGKEDENSACNLFTFFTAGIIKKQKTFVR